MKTKTTLKDLYSFPGFRALVRLKAHPEDPDARIVTLRRRQKKVFVPAATMFNAAIMTAGCIVFAMSQAPARACMWSLSTAGFSVQGVRP